MDGVILFADDHIFDTGRLENALFQKFNTEGNFSIIPFNNLNVLEKSVSSISTYKALILDWNFQRVSDEEDDDEDGLQIPDENPYEFLKNNKIFSVVYIYSQADIGVEEKAELERLFPGKIFFEKKKPENEADTEYQKILDGIKTYEDANKHLTVPYVWSKAINLAAQNIFFEFEIADKFWIKELYYGSVRKVDKTTGKALEVEVEPTIEVINLFQNILSERLIQNTDLLDSISSYALEHFKETPDPSSIVSLYSKLYYTSTFETDTVMTGDVYKLSDDCYGIVISPECDMMKLIKKNELVEMLTFCDEDFKKIKNFCKEDDEIKRAYNQELAAIHLLPIFPFSTEPSTALIDFRFSLKLVKANYLETNRANRKLKINSPYIQQLRQRYLSYVGRVGVPPIPESLKFTS